MNTDELPLEEVVSHLKTQAGDNSWSGIYVSAPAAEAIEKLQAENEKLNASLSEDAVVRRLDTMAAESLPPDIYEMWLKVFACLCDTRKNLTRTAPF